VESRKPLEPLNLNTNLEAANTPKLQVAQVKGKVNSLTPQTSMTSQKSIKRQNSRTLPRTKSEPNTGLFSFLPDASFWESLTSVLSTTETYTMSSKSKRKHKGSHSRNHSGSHSRTHSLSKFDNSSSRTLSLSNSKSDPISRTHSRTPSLSNSRYGDSIVNGKDK